MKRGVPGGFFLYPHGNTFDAKRTFQDRQIIHPTLILLSKIRPVTPEVAGSSPVSRAIESMA
jgi:hypothetical protein